MQTRFEHCVETVPAAEQAPCPSWCEQEHLDVVAGDHDFHHDGPVRTVALHHGKGKAPSELFVTTSQHVRAGVPTQPGGVDLHDEFRSVARLSPDECLRLSEALRDAAAMLLGEGGSPDPTTS